MKKSTGRTRQYKTPTSTVTANEIVEDSVAPEQAIDTTETAEKKPRKQRAIPARIQELNAQLIRYGTLYDARDVWARYASVHTPVELRGLWRVAGRKTIRLTDCFVEILRVVKPMSTSNSRDFTIYVRFINPHDETLELALTRQNIDEDTLASQFLKFGSLPETKLHKDFLMEAIKEVMKHPDIPCQLQADSLGWCTLSDGSIAWLLVNGCETVTGFVASEQAPFVGPTFVSPGNGYYGQEVDEAEDTAMSLLLNDLLPNGHILLASLLGLAARIMVPIPEDDTPGMLRFVSEIIGPPRHGKSRVLNAFLSMFGVRFEYDKGTLLNEHGGSDSKIGRLQLSAIMRYQMFSDFDHKVQPGNSLFDKVHTLRAVTNNVYSDDTGGGVVGTQRGGMRARAKPTGCLIRTSNYDHSQYSLRHDEENIEARVCSFVWPKDEDEVTYQHANDSVSHELETMRTDIYVWGAMYRKWYMQLSQVTITSLVEDMLHQARSLVYPHTWGCDLHRNQTVEIVLGLLLWKRFLDDCYPHSFMVDWIDKLLHAVILDRLDRCLYVHTLAGKFSEENKLATFTTATLRYLLTSQQCYIKSKKKEVLREQDTSYDLEMFGYRQVTRQGSKDTYEAGKIVVGYHDRRDGKEYIGFITSLLYDTLNREAERTKITLPDKDTLIDQLIDSDVIVADKEGKPSFPLKVAGKTGRYTLIAIDTIFPHETSSTTSESEEEQQEQDEQQQNVLLFKKQPTSIDDILNQI